MSTAQIPLGFAVPSGDPVSIPVGHMAVVGQTQQAGKTTTLEACAWRVPDDFSVLAFVTKRGEGGFTNGVNAVPPYFKEQANWEYVSSILEATLRERMKFERSWIMRACKGAKSLSDVHRNVKTLMATAKGLSADIYYQLDHYLDKIVPQVKAIGPSIPLMLARTSVNVMDLAPFTGEMQGLVIASCLETAYRSLQKTIIVVPEAWEFMPRTRRSPVTYAAELYIRKGGALQNYLWIDSQDLAGVHTPVLKQVQVWLLGVQREINEVKRTLAHIHGVKKPKVDAVAGLGLGQFIACHGQTVQTTYVQPVWMNEASAAAIAQGDYTPEQTPAWRRTHTPQEADPMDAKLAEENERLRGEVQTLQQELKVLQERLAFAGEPPRRAGTTPLHGRPLDEDGAIEFIKPATQADFQRDFSGRGSRIPPVTAGPMTPPGASASEETIDAFYHGIRARILQDAGVQAALVKISARAPELVVELTPREVTFATDNPRGRLAKMIAQGLLDQPVKPGVIINEFARTGGSVHPSRLSEYLGDFVQLGMVTREEGGLYVKAPGLKVTTRTLEATT